jgi:tetraacyldisaccharide 4'-kinase
MSKFRKLLFPLSVVYDGVTRIKNSLYNMNIISSKKFNIPLIIIGNLSVGGTGKTPHTEYISNLIKSIRKTAVLSRGYGRKTSGYVLADPTSKPNDIGDEPLQIFKRITNITVAVCEDRATGIKRLISEQNVATIVLDDAFQHRKIKGSLQILITTFNKPFYDDLLLPAGNLRESISNKSRADIIIVSKCPGNLTRIEKDEILQKIRPLPHQRVFFTAIKYNTPISFHGTDPWMKSSNVLLVSGIVNPIPLQQHLQEQTKMVATLSFKDHHKYTVKDIEHIHQILNKKTNNYVVATTSKDRVKLEELTSQSNSKFTFFEIPITIGFLFNQEKEFNTIISTHVRTYKTSS